MVKSLFAGWSSGQVASKNDGQNILTPVLAVTSYSYSTYGSDHPLISFTDTKPPAFSMCEKETLEWRLGMRVAS